jgi:hypothetical protein
VLQGGHAATLQQTHGKRVCSQNDKMDRVLLLLLLLGRVLFSAVPTL